MMTWEERYAEFLERVMAIAAMNGDPKPLQEELAQLMAERPKEKEGSK